MVSVYPDYWEAFHCLAGACPDTCCGQWEIVVDREAEARYRAVGGELGEQIRRALTVVDGETVMALQDGHCPLLTEEGLCPIVTALGEDFLSVTCHTHPRFTEIYGGLRETMLSISCPEAARLLLTRTAPLTFTVRRDDAPPEPNDLDPALFLAVSQGRDTAMAILQRRSLELSDRLALFLEFSARLERLIAARRYVAGQTLSDRYRGAEYGSRRLTRLRRRRGGGDLEPLRHLLGDMEHLAADAPALFDALEAPTLLENQIPLEQLAVYLLFRWWRKASCDGFLWRQAAAIACGVLTVAALTPLCGGVVEAARCFSKEVEHSAENLALLRVAMEGAEFSLSALLTWLPYQEGSHAI